MLSKALLLALAVSLAATAWLSVSAGRAKQEAAQWRSQALAAQAAIGQAKEAAAVHRAHLDRERKRMDELQTALDALDEIEGGDAPVSDYLRTVLDRVR